MIRKVSIQAVLIFAISILKATGQSESFYVDSFSQCRDKYYDAKLKKTIIYSADSKPMFPGGASAYMQYLNREFRYPKGNNLSMMQTSTMADFVVDIDGAILKPRIVKRFSRNGLTKFESEYLRVIKKMPKWKPGKCSNKTVSVIVRLPIKVELNEEYLK